MQMETQYRVATPNGYHYFPTFPDAYEYAVSVATQLAESVFIDKLEIYRSWEVEYHGEVVNTRR